jgi:GntR family transcriptional regulator of arabinose operon
MTEHTKPCLYEEIQNDLIQKIQNGIYRVGEKIPSEMEIAKLYHVSRITATKALTELSLSGYIYRLQGKGSYVNAPDKRFKPGTLLATRPPAQVEGTKKIGLIIPEHSDYHSSNIIRGVIQTLPFPDYYVNIVLSQNEHLEEYALNFMAQNAFSGIILFPVDSEFYSDVILQMHVNKYPLVLIDRYFPGISCSSVICDNRKGASMATEHLIAAGHEKIAFFADAAYQEQITSIRYDSYIKTMISHNLQVMSYENFFREGTATQGHQAFINRVKTGEITAVVASNSHVAIKIVNLCKSNNITLPGQLSIICFDMPDVNDPLGGDFAAYIEQDSLEMGRQAAAILHDMLIGKAEGKRVVLMPKLVANTSKASA